MGIGGSHSTDSIILFPVKAAIIPIKSIDRIINRCNKKYIMCAGSDSKVSNHQGLRIYQVVNYKGKQLAKLRRIHIGCSKTCFQVIQARTGIIIMLGEY